MLPGLNAYENIELPLLLAGKNGKQRKERVTELLEAVDLADRARHRPDQMSGGEQQRVAVARALATNPILILADEPTANLDAENSRHILETMGRLNRDLGTTFVFATHDQKVIDYLRRKITLFDGAVAGDERMEPRQLRGELK